MSVKQRLPLKVGKRLVLQPHVRSILSSGMDFFDDLSDMEPIQRDKFGKVQRNLWVFIEGYHTPNSWDPPSWLPDARLDFLREQWVVHRDEVTRWHITKWPGTRPWSWWLWSAPEPYPVVVPTGGSSADYHAAREKQETEALRILLRHDLLTQEEIFLIHARDAANAALRASGPEEEEVR